MRKVKEKVTVKEMRLKEEVGLLRKKIDILEKQKQHLIEMVIRLEKALDKS